MTRSLNICGLFYLTIPQGQTVLQVWCFLGNNKRLPTKYFSAKIISSQNSPFKIGCHRSDYTKAKAETQYFETMAFIETFILTQWSHLRMETTGLDFGSLHGQTCYSVPPIILFFCLDQSSPPSSLIRQQAIKASYQLTNEIGPDVHLPATSLPSPWTNTLHNLLSTRQNKNISFQVLNKLLQRKDIQ